MNNVELRSLDEQLKPFIEIFCNKADSHSVNNNYLAVIYFKHPNEPANLKFYGEAKIIYESLSKDGMRKAEIEAQLDATKAAKEELIKYCLEKGYITKPVKLFNFATALVLLQGGAKITRSGWNGKGMWLSISCPESKEVDADNFWSPHNAEFARNNGGKATVAPCITFKNAQDEIVMGWLPSSGDLFANDWMVVE